MKIRRITAKDLETRAMWMNSPLVYKTMHFVPPISLDNIKKWYQANIKNTNRFDATIEDNEGNLLAFGGLTNIDYSVRKAELYLFVNPDKLGRGIGKMSTSLLCQYGFEILQLHKIYLYTNVTNIGAVKTYERVGFQLEGVHRDENIVSDKYENRLYYGLLAKDFNNLGIELVLSSDNVVK